MNTTKGQGATTAKRVTRIMDKLTNAGLVTMLLVLGLTFSNGDALAKESKPQNARVEKQADKDRQDKREDDQQERRDEDRAPTIALSAGNAASLYPAPFALEAAVTFPGKAERHNDKREGVEIEFLANGIKFAEAERAPYRASFTPPQAGLYTLTARIHYGEGHRFIESNTVNIVSDLPPTIALTGPANNTVVTAPASFALAATAGSQFGTIAKVEFYNGATLVGTATTASAGSYTTTWSNVPYGTYSLTAKATDNYGFSTTTAPITVISNQPPQINLTAPANNAVVAAPGSFTLAANASDVDGTVAKVEFYNGTTLIGTATAAPYSYTWANVPAGVYSITAKAMDNYGASTTTAPISLISDTPPPVSLTNPANNAIVHTPVNVSITADAASAMSTIAKVEFYNGTTLLGSSATAPYSFTWNSVAVGNYSLTAVATDNYGIQTTSAPISLTVKLGELLPYYIHTDHLDTPREITDTGGNVVWQWDNADPFGNNAPNENPGGLGKFEQPLRFPGQYADKETNLYYNINRDYDPAIGRYPQSDPIGLKGGINTYAYVNDNPISYVDPLGLQSWTIGFFPGVGGQLTFGQNPNGSGFMSVQFGWGIGGGISYNPLGQQPGYSPSQGNSWGIGLGLYGQAGFRAGPIGANIGANVGRNYTSCGDNAYGGLTTNGAARGLAPSGIAASISGGGQITIFGGGTRQ